VPRSATIAVRWRDGLVFEGLPDDGRPPFLVDGDTSAAVSPVELLLVAAATCTAADVVSILKKMRVDLARVEVEVHGTRRDEEPRRFTAIRFAWTIAGAGADETKVRRAIDLSIEKYCSVLASLAPDIAVTYDVTLV
jgi:putative redox protein